jgi:uncharacterized iron-regulated membrane protein
MTIRKALFWTHLVAGCIGGLVILIMSLTGVLLMYERQILANAERGAFRRAAPAAGAQRLPVEELLRIAGSQGASLPRDATLTLRADPREPAEISAGREGAVYYDPYTGQALGAPKTAWRPFFRQVTAWHRWLGAEGESRATAKAITGACNLAFLFLVLTGLYLWIPKRWTRQHLSPVVWFRGGLSGKARDFNWHNVFGLWMAAPLAFVVASAVPMSYTWGNNLLYKITGTQPQPGGPGGPPGAKGMRERRGGADGGEGAARGERGEGSERGERGEAEHGERAVRGDRGGRAERAARGDRGEADERGERAARGERGEAAEGGARAARGEAAAPADRAERGERAARGEGERGDRTGRGAAPTTPDWTGLNQRWAQAEASSPGWRSISLRLPDSPRRPVTFTIDRGDGGQPQRRSSLTLDRATGAVIRAETFDSMNAGRRLRMWTRFIHTGEAFGLVGQTLAGLASAAGVMLVWTGIALSLRRFTAWRRRRARAPEPAESMVAS